MKEALFLYMGIINLVTFVVYGMDKQKARRRAWRIPEKTLLGLAVIGGSIGALCGMSCFRHKTKHLKFTIGVPTILVVQMLLILLLMCKGF